MHVYDLEDAPFLALVPANLVHPLLIKSGLDRIGLVHRLADL